MLRNDEMDFQEYVKLAQHFQAIGDTELYLSGDGEKPWKYVTGVEPGGSHRLDIATSVSFKAAHPCGLEFRWSFNIEPHSANGRSGYYIDIDAIQRVLAKLPMEPATKFVTYLKSCADAVEKKADEYQDEAKRQYGTAHALRRATVAEVTR